MKITQLVLTPILLLPLIINFSLSSVNAPKDKDGHEEDNDDDEQNHPRVNLGNDVNAEAWKRQGRDFHAEGRMGRYAVGDVFDSNNLTENSSIDEDFASFLLPIRNNSNGSLVIRNVGCLQIPDEQHIPPGSKGMKNYNEGCDPSPNAPEDQLCKRYETLTYEDAKTHKWEHCLKPTHFICDPIRKKCGCGHDSNMISQIRFQIGNAHGKNKTHGICFVRPTFDYIDGFECAPGTTIVEVILDEDETPKPVHICTCPRSEGELDKFSSSDPDWWTCDRGCSMEVGKLLLFFSVTLTLIQFSL